MAAEQDLGRLTTELHNLNNTLNNAFGGGNGAGGAGGFSGGGGGMNASRSGEGFSMAGIKRTEKLLSSAQKAFSNSTNSIAKKLGEAEVSVEQMNAILSGNTESRLRDFNHMMATVTDQGKREEAFLKAFGYALDETIQSQEDFLAAEKAIQKEAMKAQRDANKVAIRHAKSLSEATKLIQENYPNATKLGAALVFSAKEAYDVAKVITATGAEFTGTQMYNAKMLGMSTAELMTLTSKYTQVMGSAAIGTNQFSNMMQGEAYESLVRLTGGTKEAAIFSAESLKMSRLAGAGTAEEMINFKDAMEKSYGGIQEMTGMTSDAFLELNTALYNNADVQASMFKMSKQQQQLYFKEMQTRRLALVEMGLLPEQADEVLKSLSKAMGGTAKDRLKDAAKLQATLGAMGMGAEGQEAAKIMRLGSRATQDQQARLQEILTKANRQSSENSQGSLQGEMVQDYLNTLSPLLGSDSPMASLITQSKLAFKSNEESHAALNDEQMQWLDKNKEAFEEFVDYMKGIVDGVMDDNIIGGSAEATIVIAGDAGKGLKGDNLALAVTGLISSITGVFASSEFASGLTGALVAALGGANLGTILSGLSANVLKLALLFGKGGLLGGALVAGLAVGNEINKKIDEYDEKNDGAIGDTIGAAVRAAVLVGQKGVIMGMIEFNKERAMMKEADNLHLTPIPVNDLFQAPPVRLPDAEFNDIIDNVTGIAHKVIPKESYDTPVVAKPTDTPEIKALQKQINDLTNDLNTIRSAASGRFGVNEGLLSTMTSMEEQLRILNETQTKAREALEDVATQPMPKMGH